MAREIRAELSRHVVQLVLFFAVFGLFIWAWSVVGDAYADVFRQGAAWCFDEPQGERLVRVDPIPDVEDGFLDTRVIVVNRAHLSRPRVPAVHFDVSSRYTGYFDLTFLLSLLLVTPMTWRRRIVVMPLALGLSHALAMARLYISVLHQGELQPALELDKLSGWSEMVLAIAQESYVADNLEAGLVSALVIWAALAFPAESWQRWFELDDEAELGPDET